MKPKNSASQISRLMIVLLVGLLTACAVKFGENFDPSAFQSWVKRGETSKQEVQEFLGPPTSQGIIVQEDGSQLTRFLYYYGKGKLSDMKNAKFKMLEIRFNENNKVNSYNWSSSE